MNKLIDKYNIITFWAKRVSEPVLSLPFVEGIPTGEKAKVISKWVRDNSDKYCYKFVKMYHGTAASIPVEVEGLKPTTSKRRRSYQSESGYVYLAATPYRAKTFGDMGNQGKCVVYEVIVRVRKLLPDTDQLNNQRSVGKEVCNTIGESIIFGGGGRVKGRIEPWAIRKMELSEYL